MNVKNGDVVQLIYNCQVLKSSETSLEVLDLERKITFSITGGTLMDTLKSADSYELTKKMGIVDLANTLLNSNGTVFTVYFKKKDGDMRKLRGYLIGNDGLGRARVADLEDSGNLRLVDLRSIYYVIMNNVKYYKR